MYLGFSAVAETAIATLPVVQTGSPDDLSINWLISKLITDGVFTSTTINESNNPEVLEYPPSDVYALVRQEEARTDYAHLEGAGNEFLLFNGSVTITVHVMQSADQISHRSVEQVYGIIEQMIGSLSMYFPKDNQGRYVFIEPITLESIGQPIEHDDSPQWFCIDTVWNTVQRKAVT